MYLDAITCANCFRSSLFRSSLLVWDGTETFDAADGQPVAVSCPECKHVYMYGPEQVTPLQVQDATDGAYQQKYPSAFDILLVCGVKGCDTPLQVRAVRRAGMTLQEITAEVATWTLHELRCPSGHPISQARMFVGGD